MAILPLPVRKRTNLRRIEKLEAAGQLNLFRGTPQIIALTPRRSPFQEGLAHEARGDYASAAALYKEEVEAQGHFELAALNNLAVLAYAGEAWTEALLYLERALEIKATLPDAHFNLGVILYDLQEPLSAAFHFSQCMSFATDQDLRADACYRRLVALQGEGREALLAHAKREAREVLGLDL